MGKDLSDGLPCRMCSCLDVGIQSVVGETSPCFGNSSLRGETQSCFQGVPVWGGRHSPDLGSPSLKGEKQPCLKQPQSEGKLISVLREPHSEGVKQLYSQGVPVWGVPWTCTQRIRNLRKERQLLPSQCPSLREETALLSEDFLSDQKFRSDLGDNSLNHSDFLIGKCAWGFHFQWGTVLIHPSIE